MTALTIPEMIAVKITLLEKMLKNHKALIQLKEDGDAFTKKILEAYSGPRRNALQSSFFAAPQETALKGIFTTCPKILLEMIERDIEHVDSWSLKKEYITQLEKIKKEMETL